MAFVSKRLPEVTPSELILQSRQIRLADFAAVLAQSGEPTPTFAYRAPITHEVPLATVIDFESARFDRQRQLGASALSSDELAFAIGD